ncbi:YcjF family protein [Labrenzia sp. PHM005]|uniref:YcjF family protein n=1 Tax=Labrenzia sp. PHM005 TaxID=2590016 RepID=UPI00114062B0|nr:YcjF family protein [Labrenzia sp. PHM005]QDG75017.1 DUF697 domain-containing protein [Labrenzia sp. PHM005]
MSKKLPKTSNRTLNDLRSAAKSALNSEDRTLRQTPPKKTAEARDKQSAFEQGENIDKSALQGSESSALTDENAMADDVVSAPPVIGRQPKHDRNNFRKSAAMQIVERHANVAALAGLVPMPWVDLAAITIVADRMLRKLARLYGVRLDRERSKQLASAMLTGMAAPGIASFTTTGLLRMTPGPHLLGIALTSVSAAVLLRIVGEVYISHLSSPGLSSDQ